MALLMLRTRDLSWQDRVANIEFMVNPVHNQLLLNKHKTLASKCDKIKRSFDSELKTKQKNYVLDIRMMERRKRSLQRRKSEIDLGMASTKDVHNKPLSSDNNMPKTNIIRGQSAPPNLNSAFMTEVELPSCGDDDTSSIVTPVPRSKTIHAWYTATNAKETPRPTTRSSIKSSVRQKSVRFNEETIKQDYEQINPTELHDRVKMFLESQKDFNGRPVSYIKSITEKNSRNKFQQTPLVAKRYANTNLDTNTLEHVFDHLCKDRSLKNFKKISAMASRVKTNFKLSRNTSVVPAMATLKSTRRFKEIIQRDEKTPA